MLKKMNEKIKSNKKQNYLNVHLNVQCFNCQEMKHYFIDCTKSKVSKEFGELRNSKFSTMTTQAVLSEIENVQLSKCVLSDDSNIMTAITRSAIKKKKSLNKIKQQKSFRKKTKK